MSTNRYIDKLKARLAKEADRRMQLQALLDDQVARNRALLAERDAMKQALEQISVADWQSSESATDNEISMAKGTLIRKLKRIATAALQGEQP